MTSPPRGRKARSAAAVAVLLLSAGTPPTAATAESATAPSAGGGPAAEGPAVEVVDAEGLGRALGALRGRAVILNFWATWCEPCREEFPDLVRFAKEHAAGVALLTVSLDDPDDVESAVKPFLRRMGAPGGALVRGRGDPDPFIAAVDPSWSGALPATFIHAADGRRVRAIHGPVNYGKLAEIVEPLLRGGD